MTRRIRPLHELRLLAGVVCLDFANTLEPREGRATRYDYVRDYHDLIEWSAHAGLLDRTSAPGLREQAAIQPRRAARVHAHAMRLREAIYRAFVAVSQQREPAQPDLDAIADVYRHALRRARLTADGSASAWRQVPAAGPTLEIVLLPIAISAVEVLTHPPHGQIKQCPGAGDCGWLFLDRSKNGSRRWCRADGCGARVKMRRHYRRARAATSATSRPSPEVETRS